MNHKVTHYDQPTNTSCGPASAAMLLSAYDVKIAPEEVIQQIEPVRDENGTDMGTPGQYIARWLIGEGFDVSMYSADFQILDFSWRKLDGSKLLVELEKIKDIRETPGLGKVYSKIYIESYIDFLELGGRLHVEQYISSKLLDSLLENGPVMTTVSYNVLYDSGRENHIGDTESELDPIHGRLINHFNVLTGIEDGKYVVEDPWAKPGRHLFDKELLIAAIQAAQIECDNLVIQIHRKAKG